MFLFTVALFVSSDRSSIRHHGPILVTIAVTIMDQYWSRSKSLQHYQCNSRNAPKQTNIQKNSRVRDCPDITISNSMCVALSIRPFVFLCSHHSDQMSEESQVSKVTLCVQILKWQWLTHWPRVGKELPGQLKNVVTIDQPLFIFGVFWWNFQSPLCVSGGEIWFPLRSALLLSELNNEGTHFISNTRPFVSTRFPGQIKLKIFLFSSFFWLFSLLRAPPGVSRTKLFEYSENFSKGFGTNLFVV